MRIWYDFITYLRSDKMWSDKYIWFDVSNMSIFHLNLQKNYHLLYTCIIKIWYTYNIYTCQITVYIHSNSINRFDLIFTPRHRRISRNLAIECHPAFSLKALRGVTCRPRGPQWRQKRHILGGAWPPFFGAAKCCFYQRKGDDET